MTLTTCLLLSLLALALTACASDSSPHQITKSPNHQIELHLRTQTLTTDPTGHALWETRTTPTPVRAAETAIIVCDMWDQHWSRGASERVAAMAPRMNQVLRAARAAGVTILHAPSDTLDFYKDAPARKRVLAAPRVELPKPIDRPSPPLPIDDSDGGSDTGEKPWHKAWSRQHPALDIDQTRDGITDSGQEAWNFLHQRGIKFVILMGVHTNMCVLNRSFAIKALVKSGMPVALCRDLTDAMYNPARAPYVSHADGTRLVIDYIEKFWCPTLASTDLAPPGAQP